MWPCCKGLNMNYNYDGTAISAYNAVYIWEMDVEFGPNMKWNKLPPISVWKSRVYYRISSSPIWKHEQAIFTFDLVCASLQGTPQKIILIDVKYHKEALAGWMGYRRDGYWFWNGLNDISYDKIQVDRQILAGNSWCSTHTVRHLVWTLLKIGCMGLWATTNIRIWKQRWRYNRI